MNGLPTNRAGQIMDIMCPQTASGVDIDGSSAHAESSALSEGIYRVAVVSSTAGVRIDIGTAPVAIVSKGAYMADQQAEYWFINAGQKISVLGGILNITLTT
jgi:hypothetical protein